VKCIEPIPVQLGERRLLLDVGQDEGRPRRPPLVTVLIDRRAVGIELILGDEVLDRDPDLPHVVAALRPPGSLTRPLHRRQEQADERGDDRDHNEQFDERKAFRRRRAGLPPACSGKPLGSSECQK
jgi:hypothetical protein